MAKARPAAEKKGNATKTTSVRNPKSGRYASQTEAGARAEKRKELTLKAFRVAYEDHQKKG